MIYAIGDIHGKQGMMCVLLAQLQAAGLRDEDQVVFLGDYVDRGENSCGVVESLLRFREHHPRCVFLRGNHEQLMLNARDADAPRLGESEDSIVLSDEMLLWLQNGGLETLRSYGGCSDIERMLHWWEIIPDTHWDFYQATEMEYITDRLHFVHAGLLPPGMGWEGESYELDPRLWIREPFLSSRHDFDGRIVVFGHTPQPNGRPLYRRRQIGIDTGAVFGGPLTAAAFDEAGAERRLHTPRIFQAPHMVDEVGDA